jgi:DNA repair protein RadC
VEVDALNQLLVNIGSKERLSNDELNAILLAAGIKDKRIIPIDKMLQLM